MAQRGRLNSTEADDGTEYLEMSSVPPTQETGIDFSQSDIEQSRNQNSPRNPPTSTQEADNGADTYDLAGSSGVYTVQRGSTRRQQKDAPKTEKTLYLNIGTKLQVTIFVMILAIAIIGPGTALVGLFAGKIHFTKYSEQAFYCII